MNHETFQYDSQNNHIMMMIPLDTSCTSKTTKMLFKDMYYCNRLDLLIVDTVFVCLLLIKD